MIALALTLARVASSMEARAYSRAVVFVIVASKDITRAVRMVYKGGEGRERRKLTDMNSLSSSGGGLHEARCTGQDQSLGTCYTAGFLISLA